ncbi:LexA family transcriptional regulator [Elizabethkingia meningoseptica]|uniref:LexA family transcriptional regulator n=1 Tax=Elizabethkingia meningoseptica TaxID=238 RepID=UPI003892BE77
MSELPTITKKIKEIIFRKADGNTKKFAEIIGVSQQKLNRLFNIDKRTGRFPDPKRTDIIEKILFYFKDINPSYLLGEEGEMISMEGKELDSNYSVPSRRKDDTVTQVDSDEYMEVEYRDLSVAAGPLNRTSSGYKKKTLLVPKEYDNGEYLVVRVDGPSMYDGTEYSIPDGANILIKRYYLNNGDKLPIRGNLFVVDAKDGQALKQIVEHNTDLGYVRCHSYNPDFEDYNVPLEDIIGFYIFRKIVGFRPPVRDLK